MDAAGNLYVADTGNNAVRRIDLSGNVTTIAGGQKGFADGIGRGAGFDAPTGIAVDRFGNILVADAGNHSIRKIDLTGMVVTLAGGGVEGYADGVGAAARFNFPTAVALDQSGAVYIADSGNQRIRRMDANGDVTTLAGDGEFGFHDSKSNQARFADPVGLALDADGRLIVADSFNSLIRSVSNGEVKTLAGTGARGLIDAAGNAAAFNLPSAITVAGNGDLYVADSGNHSIRRIRPSGTGPIINSFSPESGPVGTVVTIKGVGFTGATEVKFGVLSALFQIKNDGECEAVCPSDAVTSPISIVTPLGKAVSPLPFTVTQGEDFSLSSDSPVLIIEQGKFGSLSIKASSIGGFSGAVSLSVRGLPAEIKTKFVPDEITPGGQESLLTIVPDPSIKTGGSRFEVVGRATVLGREVEHALGLTLVVKSGPDDFSLSAGPTSARITAGASASFEIAVTGINGFAGSVNLSAAELPAGAKGSFLSPVVAAGGSTLLTVIVPKELAAGSYSFAVNGSAIINGRQVVRSVRIGLVVDAAVAGADFFLLASPEKALLYPGKQISVKISVRSIDDFNGDVSLGIDRAPAGVNFSFSPATANPNKESVLTLTADSTAPAGRYNLILTGQSGELKRSSPFTLVIAGTAQDTSLRGVVMTAEDSPKPIPGVTISAVSNPALQVITDSSGKFTLGGLPPQITQLLNIDGHTADTASDTFPVIPISVEIVPNTANEVGWIIYIPKIDTASQVKIEQDSVREQVIVSPRIPNLKFVIPAHTKIVNLDGSPVTQVSVTALRSDRAPMPLPDGVSASPDLEIYSVQPGGAVASKPVQYYFSNLKNNAPGARISLWTADHDLGIFRVYGSGFVGSDGLQIIPDIMPENPEFRFGLSQFSWSFPLPPCEGAPPTDAPRILSLVIDQNPLKLAPGESEKLRVKAFLSNFTLIDVTDYCTFSSGNSEIVSVQSNGLATASSASSSLECPATTLTARLRAAPPGVQCDPNGGGSNSISATTQAIVKFELNISLTTIDLSLPPGDQVVPLPFDGNTGAALKGVPVYLNLSVKNGSRLVVVKDSGGKILFKDLVKTATTIVTLDLNNLINRFFISLGEQECQTREIVVYRLPEASITKIDPTPVPLSRITDPTEPVKTLVDATVEATLNPSVISFPVLSVELQVRKGDRPTADGSDKSE
ncbi:MAG TPA: IPT/TIG domain-containing protein, partial [Pyrinomonadaceae bacterium]|nr:IPT/TIG domain-containing protein [Pyrinomonadaceae bacterium]